MTSAVIPGRDTSRKRTAAHVLLLVSVCAVLFLYRTGSLPLADPEEPRCALIVREMDRGGDWLVPHLDGAVYYDKPAPYFWLAALGQKLTGSPELGGRLVSALAGTLAVVVTYFFGRRLFSPTAGLMGGLMLATGGVFLYVARWYRMEMPCVAAMWAAMWWFWRVEDAPDDRVRRRRWYGFYLFCAVATLMKGPIGLGLPVLIVGTYLLLSGRPRRVLELFHLPGMLLYLLVAAPWYVVMSLRVPGYAAEFFIQQNLARFTEHTGGAHGMPALLFIPVVLAGLLPWVTFLPSACARGFPRRWRHRAEHPGELFLWLSALVPLGFFMLSGTKLVHYVLPVFAPLAVLLGGAAARWTAEDAAIGPRRGAWMLSVSAMVLPVLLVPSEMLLGSVDFWLGLPWAVGVAGVVGVWMCVRRHRRSLAFGVTVAAVIVVLLFIFEHTAPPLYNLLSTRALARCVNPSDASSASYWFWDTRKLSFEFYVDAPVHRGSHDSPGALERLVAEMASDRRVYCLVSHRERFVELQQRCPGRFFVL
ncbi:MAG TPA: glycosyltransferase family 39 protein, partial [Planctomycetota bacterium]|nr:glycosyltransferase family 39 protein [Planctomycetota bacterium]